MSEPVLVETKNRVGVLTLNRPQVLNALSREMLEQLVAALAAFDADPNIRVMVVTGGEKAFSAGADIAGLAHASPMDIEQADLFALWERLRRIRKPLIAAVSGYALGGGCELALHCDIVIASESARFGQPEIKLGIMPGDGATQLLPRTIGRFRAMDMVLTGRFIPARQAYDAGLVSRVTPRERFLDEAMALADELATRAPIAVQFAKQAVRKAHETTLAVGLDYERRLYAMLYATRDQKEGMAAFLEKREPLFHGL